MKNQTKILISIGSVILLALIVLLVVRSVVKASARIQKRKEDEQIAEIHEEQQEVLDNLPQPPKATYSKDAYGRLATRLHEAMDSQWYNPFSYGTAETEVVKVFSYVKNDTDFLNLGMAFGNRDGYAMQDWVKSELSSSWIDMINKKLSTKGVKYRL